VGVGRHLHYHIVINTEKRLDEFSTELRHDYEPMSRMTKKVLLVEVDDVAFIVKGLRDILRLSIAIREKVRHNKEVDIKIYMETP